MAQNHENPKYPPRMVRLRLEMDVYEENPDETPRRVWSCNRTTHIFPKAKDPNPIQAIQAEVVLVAAELARYLVRSATQDEACRASSDPSNPPGLLTRSPV